MKNKGLILIGIIILILGALYTYNDTAKYLVDDMVYFIKANEWYVSRQYSINIENSTNSGKDYAFWGQDKKTDKLMYVVYIYHKGTYLVDGNEGITMEEVKKVATQNGVEPLYISLLVIDLFREDKSIVDYIYWVIDYENVPSKYVRFSDGKVEENPFNTKDY